VEWPPQQRPAIDCPRLSGQECYGFVHTRQLLEVLANDATLRRLCGWTHARQIPHESTFSRAFAEFANS